MIAAFFKTRKSRPALPVGALRAHILALVHRGAGDPDAPRYCRACSCCSPHHPDDLFCPCCTLAGSDRCGCRLPGLVDNGSIDADSALYVGCRRFDWTVELECPRYGYASRSIPPRHLRRRLPLVAAASAVRRAADELVLAVFARRLGWQPADRPPVLSPVTRILYAVMRDHPQYPRALVHPLVCR